MYWGGSQSLPPPTRDQTRFDELLEKLELESANAPPIADQVEKAISACDVWYEVLSDLNINPPPRESGLFHPNVPVHPELRGVVREVLEQHKALSETATYLKRGSVSLSRRLHSVLTRVSYQMRTNAASQLEYERLQEKYKDLDQREHMSRITTVQSQQALAQLQQQHKTLQQQHATLLQQHQTLQQQHRTLKEHCSALEETNNRLLDESKRAGGSGSGGYRDDLGYHSDGECDRRRYPTYGYRGGHTQ